MNTEMETIIPPAGDFWFDTIEKLNDISQQIDECQYPETSEIICESIDKGEEFVYYNAFTISEELQFADASKRMPMCIAKFIIKIYKNEIEFGNSDAACNLGALYYTGRAGIQSYLKAIKYYKIAADSGNEQAQENLGYCYYYGRDTKVDYEKAFNYFALGAFSGRICSLYKIGDMYRNGCYVERNHDEAFRIYSRCMDAMEDSQIPLFGADVMMRIGDCYFEGIGTEVDYNISLRYYQTAECLFFERLKTGDFMIKDCYDKVISRQDEARKRLREELPDYSWT